MIVSGNPWDLERVIKLKMFVVYLKGLDLSVKSSLLLFSIGKKEACCSSKDTKVRAGLKFKFEFEWLLASPSV